MESLREFGRRLRQSLYLVPLIFVALAIAAARVTITIDHQLLLSPDVPGLLSVSLNGGRAIAAAVAGATITVAAIVFSITALSSQIAATQYSPRAVAGFLEDRFQKLVIGLVVGTFAFALMVLAELGGAPNPDLVTQTSSSVTAVLVLGVGSVVAIVAYLDHSLRRMRIDAVVRRIAEATTEAVRRQQRDGSGVDTDGHDRGETATQRVYARRTGWVLEIEAAAMARRLAPRSVTRIEVRVGEAVMRGDLIATVWGAESVDAEEVIRPVLKGIHLGRDRSIDRDPGYGIRQLIDIGLRALSPGINDPTTAVDVVQHLKLPLRAILTLSPPRRIHSGPAGQRVFMPEADSRSEEVHKSFAQIRAAAADHPAVLEAIIDVAADLAAELESNDLGTRAVALREQAKLALDLARQGHFAESDLEPVLAAAKRLDLEG